MARKNALDDHSKRDGVLHVLANGGTIDAAAKEVGVSHMAIARYRDKFPEYDEAVKRAMAEGYLAARRNGTRAILAEHAPSRPRQKPAPVDAEVVSEEFDLDEDFAKDAGAAEPDVVDPLTEQSFMDLCWRRASSPTRKDAASWGRLLAPVMFGPMIRGQERREADQVRRGVMDEQKALTVEGTPVETAAGPGRRRGAMMVLEVPPNKARPHLNREPEESEGADEDAGIVVVGRR